MPAHELRLIAGLAAALALAVPGTSAADPPPPDRDPFYRPPASLASYAPGAIIRSRQVDAQIGPAPVSALGATSYQLLYRTNEPSGRPVVNVTTLIVPSGPKPAGGRQVLSLQDAEDSLTTNCAPSYQLQVAERDNQDLLLEMPAVAPAQLAAGRVLVIPDPYGPRSEFLVTAMEAHAILDSIRAVERFPAAQVGGRRTPVALAGYSGGGHETAAAAELHPAYAPELNIVGAAAGGIPVGDRESFDYLDDGRAPGVVMGAMIALQRAYPNLDWDSLLNADGRAVAARQTSGDGCVGPVVSGGGPLRAWTNVPDALSVPRIKQAIADNALGHAAPAAPSFLYISLHDELISVGASDKLAARYCTKGGTVDYYRDPVDYTTPKGDHTPAALGGFLPRGLAYLDDRFTGSRPPTTCPPGTVAGDAPAARSCRSSRSVTVHIRIPSGLRVRRIRVTVDGRLVRTLHHRTRAVRVALPKSGRSVQRVKLRVAGTQHGRPRTVDIHRTVRTCR